MSADDNGDTNVDGDVDVDVPEALAAISDTQPLIDAVTNAVTINGVANTILGWGGLPVMADDLREVAEMVAGAEGCLLNTGDVSDVGEATMLAAGRAANERDIPVVLDPVGAGSTPTRTAVTERLIEEVNIAVINGNRAEIAVLADEVGGEGETSEIRGVEAVGRTDSSTAAATALACARETGAVVVASGETDVVADGEAAYTVAAGDPMMGRVVGTGCMLGGTLSVFAASVDDPLAAALAGTLAYGLAGERAAAGDYGEYAGPASYETCFRDAMAGFDASIEGTDGVEARIDRVATAE